MSSTISTPISFADHTRWYIRLRWFLLVAVSVPGILAVYLIEGWTGQIQKDIILALLAIASNGVFYFLGHAKKSEKYFQTLAACLLALDVALITYLIYSKGGIESRSMILYAVPILMSAPLFGRRGIYATAMASLFMYSAVILGSYFKIFSNTAAMTNLSDNTPYVINTIIFFSLIILIIGFLADYITALLINKEQQASATAATLKRAQTIAKMGSWQWDVSQNKITWSDELSALHGLPAGTEHMDFDGYLKRLHPTDRSRVETVIKAALADHRPFGFDYRVVRPDRKQRIMHGEGEVVLDETGRPVQMFGTARDITEERALDTAKGDFVSLASHQLRTPATGVKMLLSLLIEGYVGSVTPEQRSTLVQAYETNERQLRIANDLLNIARLEAGKLTLRKHMFTLNEWLERVIDAQRSVIEEKKQVLELNIPNRQVTVNADAERLEMVIDNLISNASKYSPAGGKITVILRSAKGRAQIAVKDTGAGIPKAELPKLFRKFSRLDTSLNTEAEGTGLGLYLAKNIMDLHRGEITVTSRPGEGTTFKILLPLI